MIEHDDGAGKSLSKDILGSLIGPVVIELLGRKSIETASKCEYSGAW